MSIQAKTIWRQVKLGDICRIKTGKTDSQDAVENGAYPLFDRSATIKRSDKFLFNTSAIILPGEGKEFEPRFYAGKFDLHQRVYAIYCDKEKRCENLDLKFLYYFLLLNREYFAQTATGATVKSLRLPIIADCSVRLPPFPTQQQVANVLSTYDDLIENNTKRIKILEEIAQAIYREWFVYYRFPGHEKVKMVDSKTDFGKIPEGWIVKNLGDKINIFRGKNITKNTIVEGKIPVVAGGLGPAYFHNKANAEGPVITVSASGANAGYVNLYHENIWASDCSYINKNSTPFVYYYYLLLKDRQIEVTGLQRGSAQPHVYAKDLARLSIVDALEKLTQAFEKKTSSLFGVINNLQVQNKKLRQARDLLLPKLVTGELEIKL